MRKSKFLAITLIATLTLVIASCSGKEANPATDSGGLPIVTDSNGFRDTPARVGTGKRFINYDKPAALNETIQEVDVIADITIAEWLGESETEPAVTFFGQR